MPTVDIDKVAVGSTYRNNIVTKVDEEVKDLKNGKVKIRRLITLDDGMIVIEDALYDFEEIVGEYKELQYNEIDFPDISPTKKKSPKKKKRKDKGRDESPVPSPPDLDSEDDDAAEELRRKMEEVARREAEEKSRLEAEDAARREAEERARLEEEERRRREAEDQARRAAEERMRLEEEQRRRREAEEERRRSEAEEADRIKRLCEAWKPQRMVAYTSDNEDKTDPLRSIWKSPSSYDTSEWPEKEVILYPPNKSLPSTARNDKSTPNGYWCYYDALLQPCEEDTEWIPQSSTSEAQFLVLLPGQEPPRGANVLIGEWCMDASTVWPPRKEPKTCIVYPPNTSPPSTAGDEDECRGIWTIGDGFPDVDKDDWNLSNVLVYETGHGPSPIDPEKPQGPCGVAKGASPNENGAYDPEDLWFVFPGEDVPSDDEWNCLGIWVLDTKDDSNWIPFKEPPTPMTVHHKDNVNDSKNRAKGSNHEKAIWISHPDVKASKWVPQKVMSYKSGHAPKDLDPSLPQGLWGRVPNAKRDLSGNFEPTATWCVFPGEDPPSDDEWECMGVWIADSDEEWKPYDEAPTPRMFNVAHPRQLKEDSDEQGTAIWRIGDGYPDIDDDNWTLAPVKAYEFGDEPEDLSEMANGLWGRAVDAEPDENGNFDPKDTWFIYPGDTSPGDDEWNCCGVWTVDDPADACVQWPPYEESEIPAQAQEGPLLATIFPAKKAIKESVETGKYKGIWKYSPGKKVMDAGKKPRDVLLYMDASDVDEKVLNKRGGVWGFAPGAEPDSEGNYSPCDLWCFAAGETPPPDDEWEATGVWIPKEPPKPATPKLSSPSTHSQSSTISRDSNGVRITERKERVRRFKKSAWVFPDEEHAPPGQQNNLQGVWSTPPGDQPGGKLGVKYKDGEPMEVVIHKKGKQPSESDLKKTAFGKWGYHKDAQPNDKGIMDPKDIIFFPPGVDCGSDVNEEGMWTCPGAIIKEMMSWKYEGENILHFKKTEIHFMDTVTTFASEFIKKA
ncbi:MAG: hypothetical protein SGILL_005073 [Bacillariaceae sp.]